MVLEADEIIKAYFKQNNIIIKHQIDSFNYFIEDIIPNILSQFFPIQMNYKDVNDSYIFLDISLPCPLVRARDHGSKTANIHRRARHTRRARALVSRYSQRSSHKNRANNGRTGEYDFNMRFP